MDCLVKIERFLGILFDFMERGFGMFRRVNDSMNYFRNFNLGLVDHFLYFLGFILDLVNDLVDVFIDSMNVFLHIILDLVNVVDDIRFGVFGGGVSNVVDGVVFPNSILDIVDVFLEVIPNMVQVILDVSFDS